MTVYFFHLRNEDTLLEDGEGTDLPSLHAALLQVLQARSELAADTEGDVDGLAFEVTDSSGRLLLKVPVGKGRHYLPSALQPHCKTDAWRSTAVAGHLH
jgi:hypothetical protein